MVCLLFFILSCKIQVVRLSDRHRGTVTFSQRNSEIAVSCVNFQEWMSVILLPTDANAATLVGSPASPYVVNKMNGSFTIKTADGSSLPNDAKFNYIII